MKYISFNFQKLALSALLLAAFNFNAQTREQARVFVSKTHVAIAKIEKEMHFSNTNNYDADIKKAIKYQLTAVKLFKENDFFNAVAYSYKSREICIEICSESKMNISERSYYALSDEDKTFCDPSKYSAMKFKTSLISAEANQKVDQLDMLNLQKFHELELGNLK